MNHSTDDAYDRLALLTEGQLLGELSAEEKLELAEMLDSSEGSQRRFVELAGFETVLAEVHRAPVAEFSIAKHDRARWLANAAKTAPWLVAAACLVIAFWPRPNLDNDSAPIAAVEDRPALSGATALLVNEANATFAPSREPGELAFDRGSYNLLGGMLHLRFSSGAELAIEGPAKFEIVDAMASRLEFGNVRAIVPPAATGFTIETEQANYEDVSTEFGLRVEPSNGMETMLVFDGEVNIRRPDSNELLLSLTDGAAFQYEGGLPVELPRVDPDSFPNPGAFGHRRWASRKEARLEDPSLLALFSFEQDPQAPTTLRNLQQLPGSRSVSDAKIHGARWVSGRWAGKEALLFDSRNEFAELEIDGELSEFTIAAWVFVDRLDNPLNAILNSNGWESGRIHFQIMRQGNPYTDIFEVKGRDKRNFGVVPTGEWTHMVATFSVSARATRVYVAGRLAFEAAMGEGERIQPGVCRIGNWLAAGPNASAGSLQYVPERSFNGKIDELAIWSRALSEAEIEAELDLGRPGNLRKRK
ncbi:MAG: hypothetical protein ACI8UO_004134 [Verrucomicrobiales bacterium]|jgi:hypothetical protein